MKNELITLLYDLKDALKQEEELNQMRYRLFWEEPTVAFSLLELMIEKELSNKGADEEDFFTACLFALDVCVFQLNAAQEGGNRPAKKAMDELMFFLIKKMREEMLPSSFWSPILNIFYSIHVELIPELKDVYLDLLENEQEIYDDERPDRIASIRAMLKEFAGFSDFDITENLFIQSHAMPEDFFSDLMVDLFHLPESQDIGLLLLLHPNSLVREICVTTFDHLCNQVTLSSVSLSRLQRIKHWYSPHLHAQFDSWVRKQRKKGVVFHVEAPPERIKIEATEIDGSGAQGVFIETKKNGKTFFAGLLFKLRDGIKDAWIVPENLSATQPYLESMIEDAITLRSVDLGYLKQCLEHFLALSQSHHYFPDLHLLAIEEHLQLSLQQCSINIDEIIQEISVKISPFNADAIQMSYLRSKTWPSKKPCASSWYEESALVDKIVNRYCSIMNGIKTCALDKAIHAVFEEVLENERLKWLFHFLWVALWAKSKARKNEKFWIDSFFIAYGIYKGYPLQDIPFMQELCYQTVLNSIDTMNERGTHLTSN